MVSALSEAPSDRCLGELPPAGPHHVGKEVSLPFLDFFLLPLTEGKSVQNLY